MIQVGYPVFLIAALACGQLGAPMPAPEFALEAPGALARAAREQGDPARGAVVFFQAELACAKCHEGEGGNPLGPDLAKMGKEVTDDDLVESILDPSKVVKKGYETETIALKDGKALTGLRVEERPDAIVLRDPAQDGKLVSIARADVEERSLSAQSIMPPGLANLLTSRQQFLDLVRYLREIADGGPDRARALRPAASLLALPPLPDYERNLDHAGLIAGLNSKSAKRGEAIYDRVCANCHGTKDRLGSMPTSVRFASGAFKNGSDPFRMYQTLTHGFGQMPAQSWMVPKQKYDVIHYIRETYLKDDNPSQYARVDPDYLARLPKGKARGPDPVNIEPWVIMDYGPSLMATIEVGDDGSNFAYKGIAVRLDPGPGGISRGGRWIVYDHDTMRVAGAWSGRGFIDWNGINFNGKHEIHPRVVGRVELANPDGPGWANPRGGSFDDPRPRGRDGRPYGPLPRSQARFRGLYHHEDRVILSYTIGDTPVLEMPGLESAGPAPVVTRTFTIGPRREALVLQVAHDPDAGPGPRMVKPREGVRGEVVVFGGETTRNAKSIPRELPVFDGKSRVEILGPRDFDMTQRDYTISARIKTRSGGSLFSKTAPGDKWVPEGKSLFIRGGRLVFDIGWVGAVTSKARVDDDRWHNVGMTFEHTSGRVRLFIDGKLDRQGQGTLKPLRDVEGSVVQIGYTAPDFPEAQSYFQGRIAEVRFYKRSLFEKELAAIAPPSNGDDHPFARWLPDASRHGSLRDETDRGHHGMVHHLDTPDEPKKVLLASLTPPVPGASWATVADKDLRLTIPAGDAPVRFTLRLCPGVVHDQIDDVTLTLAKDGEGIDLARFTKGGPPRWPGALTTRGTLGSNDGPFAVDDLAIPRSNPWSCQLRLTGFDFDPDGRRAVVCTWDGDVWSVRGVDRPEHGLTWQRIASGLFQPLGLKIVEGKIFVACRDQIAILRDLNGDGEADFIECFNSDHQVTEHFHEFAMDLQMDPAGNFYYAKGARHGKTALVPQHGTLLRVSPDGARTDILATGFRAPNGVCLNPDGTFFMTDQEGHWTPKNRINWVRPGRFYGNMWAYHDITDTSDDAMEPPLCWITNAIDRSPAEIVRVESEAWGPLKGSLLSLSYGYGKVFVVPHERVGDQMQGGVCELPIPQFPTGIMRGRFHPANGALYTCGMFAWAGTQSQAGGFYRIRPTGKPLHVPIDLHASPRGMAITFSGPLDRHTVADASHYAVKTWSLQRTENYGSKHIDERPSPIKGARLSDDGRTVFLEIPGIAPTWSMETTYALKGDGGEAVKGVIHNTIHRLQD